MSTPQRSHKVNCTKCGKRQGNCFAFCVMCGAKLPQQRNEINLLLKDED